jgi:hypothetical protein
MSNPDLHRRPFYRRHEKNLTALSKSGSAQLDGKSLAYDDVLP